MQVFGRPFSHPALTTWSVVRHRPGSPFFGAPDFSASFPETYPSSIDCRGDRAILSFGDLARFGLDFAACEIVILEQAPHSTPEDLAHFIFDHIAPRILARLGHLVLHGAALARDGVLVALIGETGAGKSTLAASLAESGFDLIGDDSVLISESAGQFAGTSIYPSLRLYPESISAVFVADKPSSAMAHYSSKRRIDVSAMSAPAREPMPIAAVFYLSDVYDAAGPLASQLSPAQLCMRCTEQSFALMPTEPTETRDRFAVIARLASQVPGFELHYERDFAHLPAVHRLIGDAIGEAPGTLARLPTCP
jgi:hypothetical protein